MRLQGRGGGDAVCEAAVYATIDMSAAEAIKKGRGRCRWWACCSLLAVRCSYPGTTTIHSIFITQNIHKKNTAPLRVL